MFTLKKDKFIKINNLLYTLINNKWVVCLSIRYNSDNTVTVYSMQYIN